MFIPLASVSRGEGPTVLLLAGNHGDEYEGQIAALKLLPRSSAGGGHRQVDHCPVFVS